MNSTNAEAAITQAVLPLSTAVSEPAARAEPAQLPKRKAATAHRDFM